MATAKAAGSTPRRRRTVHHRTARPRSALAKTPKNFHSGRATKHKAGRLAYRYARKAISRCKNDPDALEELAKSLILAIDL